MPQLSTRHNVMTFSSWSRCRKCPKAHHTPLHFGNNSNSYVQPTIYWLVLTLQFSYRHQLLTSCIQLILLASPILSHKIVIKDYNYRIHTAIWKCIEYIPNTYTHTPLMWLPAIKTTWLSLINSDFLIAPQFW